LKSSNNQTYYDQNGAVAYSKSETGNLNKTLAGVVVGASFALDQKTDLRVSYTKYQTWHMETKAGQPEDNKISNVSFGLTIKF
jgi:hypothetical protein